MKCRHMAEKLGLLWLRSSGARGCSEEATWALKGWLGCRLVSGMTWRCREKEWRELSRLFSVYLRVTGVARTPECLLFRTIGADLIFFLKERNRCRTQLTTHRQPETLVIKSPLRTQMSYGPQSTFRPTL